MVIEFAGLWTYSGTNDRLPLSQLPDRLGEHVHGELQVLVNGRRLPSLGYFGVDDVCFNEWVHELHTVRELLEAGTSAVYVYDEGEQGQPAYEFRRVDNTVLVSVIEGSGGGSADADWQGVPCLLTDLAAAIDRFEEALRAQLGREAADVGLRWMDHVIRGQ